MKNSFNLNRLWIALSTLFLIGLVFAYYFFIYVPDKENLINNKKYRALKRTGQNFIAMRNDYQRSIKQEIWDHKANLQGCYDKVTSSTRDTITNKEELKYKLLMRY